jgi:translation elongation factor P/translation initiation factor 5A
VVVIKPNPRDDFNKMEMTDKPCQFMYQNGDEFVLMDTKTLEEYSVPVKYVDPNLARLIEGGTQVKLRLNEGKPVMVSAGQSVKCTVANVIDNRESTDKKKYVHLMLIR